MKLNPKEIANKALGAVAGSIAGNMANKAVARFMPNASPLIRGGALILAATVLPGLLGSSGKAKGSLVDYASAAVIGQGATTILQTIAPGLISGVNDADYLMGVEEGVLATEEMVNGSEDLSFNNPVADNVGSPYTI